MRKQKPSVVHELLKDARPPRRCVMEQFPELLKALREFLDLKEAHDSRVQHISTSWFYAAKLRPRFNGPCVDSAFDYVRNHWRRDPSTGKKL